jgi:Ca2+-binding EF-hand superfamily protein
MDLNGDGSITSHELQQTLRQMQAGSEFSLKTVELLIAKYDKNGDREIEFSEFADLFNNLNDEFENFLMMDTDDSGTIDITEFETAFTKKGYNFHHDFFKLIMEKVHKHTGCDGIKFDNYIRIMARFDFLCKSYRNTPYFHKNSLEHYLKKTFFQDFW